MKAKLLANLNWLVADKILRLVGGLFIGVWVARYLGPELFGVLNYALAFVALFGTVAKLGIDQIAVRDLTRFPEREEKILGTVLCLKLVVSLIVLMLVIPTAWIAQDGDLSFTVLVSVIAVGMIFNALDAYDIYYQAHILSRYVVLARSTAFIVFSAVRVALILGEYPVAYFAASATLELALGGGILVWLYKRKRESMPKWYFDRGIMTSLLRDGWPLIISSALIVIHTRIDQVMIGQMLGNVDVGIYSVAIRLSDTWLFLPMLIVQTVTPYVMKLRESNPMYYQARLLQLYSLMFWLGVLAGILTILFGKLFIALLFGEQYKAAYFPLVLTIWTGIFISQGVARGIWMISENMQGYRLVNNLIAVPMNIALNWYLIPKYGIVGASIASLASIGLGTWFVPFLFRAMRASNRQMLLSINPRFLFARNL
jgi:O-antigen/teichoic acid export membrane protein